MTPREAVELVDDHYGVESPPAHAAHLALTGHASADLIGALVDLAEVIRAEMTAPGRFRHGQISIDRIDTWEAAVCDELVRAGEWHPELWGPRA